jgi:hypothetical protein
VTPDHDLGRVWGLEENDITGLHVMSFGIHRDGHAAAGYEPGLVILTLVGVDEPTVTLPYTECDDAISRRVHRLSPDGRIARVAGSK